MDADDEEEEENGNEENDHQEASEEKTRSNNSSQQVLGKRNKTVRLSGLCACMVIFLVLQPAPRYIIDISSVTSFVNIV